jgi:hydrogenase nickel incorporation protein HypA/HybF
MHELGIVFEIIKTVEKLAVEQNLDEIDTIVLEVGELCSIVPMYLEECFPAAIDNRPHFTDTKLKLEIIPGEAKCLQCSNIFNVVANKGYCPQCDSFDKELLRGQEFIIKEILIKDL